MQIPLRQAIQNTPVTCSDQDSLFFPKRNTSGTSEQKQNLRNESGINTGDCAAIEWSGQVLDDVSNSVKSER